MYPHNLLNVAVFCLHLLFSLARKVHCLTLERQSSPVKLQVVHIIMSVTELSRFFHFSGGVYRTVKHANYDLCGCCLLVSVVWMLIQDAVQQDAQLYCGEGDKVYILLHHWKTTAVKDSTVVCFCTYQFPLSETYTHTSLSIEQSIIDKIKQITLDPQAFT